MVRKKTKKEKPATSKQDPESVDEKSTTDTKDASSGIVQKLKNTSRKQKIISAALAAICACIILYAVPTTRYAALNTIGSADASLTVKNSVTNDPVKGVEVALTNGDTVTTDEEGVAFFNDTKYGSTSATISKTSYSVLTIDLTISEDNIQLGEFLIEPQGISVIVSSRDWLTEKSIVDFTVKNDDQELEFTSKDGFATLNIPYEASGVLSFTVASEGYTDSQLQVDTATIVRNPSSVAEQTNIPVDLTISGKHHFTSNRDGDVGFYSVNYDGTDSELLVSTELDIDHFNSYPIKDTDNVYAALLPSKETDPYTRDRLAIVKPAERSLEIVDEAEGQDLTFDIVSVTSKLVIYRVIYDEDRSDKYKLKSYNLETGKLSTHFISNRHFWPYYPVDHNDVYLVGTTEEQVNEYPYWSWNKSNLVKIDLDTGNATNILEGVIVDLYSFDNDRPNKLVYRVTWGALPGFYIMDLSDNSSVEYFEELPDAEEQEEIPDSEKGQSSPNDVNRVWIDQRDGKNRLVINSSDNLIGGQSTDLSVNSIVRWIDDTKLTVTAYDGNETADYIIDTETGNYRKITNSFRSSSKHHGY